MNDFEGLLATDYGFKPQGKSAPMAASSKGSSIPSPASSLNFDLGSRENSRSTKNSNSFSASLPNDGDSIYAPTNSRRNQLSGLDEFLGGSGKFKNKLESREGDTDFNFDSMFRGSSKSGAQSMNSPIYDQPVYDDDIFDGVPGLKSSSKVKYDNVFVSSSSPNKRNAPFDDLLGGFGKTESASNSTSGRKVEKDEKGVPAFDDLLPGFGGSSSPPGNRTTSESKWSSEPITAKTTAKPLEDPFTVSGNFSDPLEEISKLGSSRSAKINNSSETSTRIFEDVDPFAGLGKSIPAFSSDGNNRTKDKSPSRADINSIGSQSSTNKATTEKTSVKSPERYKPKKSVEYDRRSDPTLFDIPTSSSDSQKFVPRSASPPSYASTGSKAASFQGNISPTVDDNLDASDDVWLTVSEIPLFTQPTSAPPPSRPPPPIPGQVPKSGAGPSSSTYSKKKVNDYYSFQNSTGNLQASKPTSVRASDVSPLDDFEEFSMGGSQINVDERANGLSNEELEMNSAAAAMKEAMDRAEAKFRHAREVREREGTKTARSKEAVQLDKDEKLVQEDRAGRQERIDRERLEREEEEEERERRRIEREREIAREIEKEREEKEREQRRLEKARELEIEREKARQAVERATREARERAAADARLKAERAAVGKANAEARERAERAAVQRAQAEARERAAAEARERAEKAAAEARERTNMEAKEREIRERAASAKAQAEARARAERAGVERAAAEARERAAASAAAAARTNQQRNENDLESFFGMGTRASSAPKHRASPSDNFFDPQPQNRYEPEMTKTASVPTASMRKASSTTNIVDDLSSIFGAARSSGDFQDVEGETEERRRARLERHQRTQERAAKALAEKNQRDLQNQMEQAERHRIGETLDVEIKRWAAGKEGNLRALLSTLQYVLWPESGWQPVSLTDLITGPAVKKVYRKATLCIHPDKVQQKGANLQQKYVAGKVFDILKEAWNKFNSEELF